jgi:replicative DNA helicase
MNSAQRGQSKEGNRSSAPDHPVPHDDKAEAAFLGGIALYPDRLEAVGMDLAPEHFYRPSHQTLFQAELELIDKGSSGRLDPIMLQDLCQRLDRKFPPDLLLTTLGDAVSPRRQHAEIILRHAASRQVLACALEAKASIDQGYDPFEVAAAAARSLDQVGTSANNTPEAKTLEELVEAADKLAPWVIPGLLRSDWRAVVVAAEGMGKSTLLRQVAVCAAQGIHPFRFSAVPPVRVLIVDAENSVAAIAETGARLYGQAQTSAGARYDASRCRVWSRPGGLDLRNSRDRADLVREIRAQQPQLVVAGPVYKLGRRRSGEPYEDAAEGIQQVLDDLRTRFGFALVLEHHAPKGEGGSRDMAPFGSQRWLAWPELGLGLYADKGGGLRVQRFRGDRMASSWPDKFTRGDHWPFQGVWNSGLCRVAG